MNNRDVNKKLEDLLNGMNKGNQGGLEQILKSDQIQKLAKNISPKEREKILNMFMGMSNDQIKAKLKNVNMSELAGLSADELLKKLR